MNKKGEFITLAIIISVLLVGGLFLVEKKIEKNYPTISYVVDISKNVSYNLKSDNLDCNLGNVIIKKEDVRYFYDDQKEQVKELFRTDTNCD